MFKTIPKETTAVFVLLAVIIILVFRNMFFGFFQQDEWLAFGFHYLLQNEGWGSVLKNAFIPRLGHYSPFNLLLEQALFNIYELNYRSWVITSLVMHVVNSFLVFIFANQLFKDSKKALLSSLIFAVAAASFQATAWVVANIGTHSSVTFALLCLILFFKFLKTGSKKFVVLSLLSLLISLLFKETAVAFFGVLPITYYLFKEKRQKKSKIPHLIIFLGVIFIVLRSLAVFIPQSIYKDTIYDQVPSVSGSPEYGKIIYNIATFPIKGVAQSVIPTRGVLLISDNVVRSIPRDLLATADTIEGNALLQKYTLEFVNIAVFAIAAFFAVRTKKIGIFALTFIMLNSIVYAISPERLGRITIMDSRNLYLPMVGTSILLVTMFSELLSKSKIKAYIFIAAIILINLFFLESVLNMQVSDGRLRRNLLVKIKSQYPTIPPKVIFYTESDSSFYGLPSETKIMPFQSGFGQTLLVWYYADANFPNEFLKGKFLWEITDQGYKEMEGRGFGYYRELNELKNALETNKLDSEVIIGYKYNSQFNSLMDITPEIRKILPEGR